MSFRLFIYYCAICGGWAAFLSWGIAQGLGIRSLENAYLRAALIAAVLGVLVAGAIGFIDALLNAVGSQRFVRVGICLGIGLAGGLIGGLIGQFLNSMLSAPFSSVGFWWASASALPSASSIYCKRGGTTATCACR